MLEKGNIIFDDDIIVYLQIWFAALNYVITIKRIGTKEFGKKSGNDWQQKIN